MRILEERIVRTNQWIAALLMSSVLYRKIQAIDGVGPTTATAMVAVIGAAKKFKNGRFLFAWLAQLFDRNHSFVHRI